MENSAGQEPDRALESYLRHIKQYEREVKTNMKKYTEKYEQKQGAKDAALIEIGKELQDVSAELEKEQRKAINAVDEGNRDAYTVATSYISYLKQRQAALIRQRDEKAAEPVCDKNELQAAQNEMLQETVAINRNMLIQLYEDWQTLKSHFAAYRSELESYNIEGRRLARMAGASDTVISLSGNSGEVMGWIAGAESGLPSALIRLAMSAAADAKKAEEEARKKAEEEARAKVKAKAKAK